MSKMSYKTRKIIKWSIIGAILTLLTLMTAFVAIIVLFFTGGPARVTTDIADYPTIFTSNVGSTGLLVFPEEITEEMSDTSFSFSYQDTFGSPTVSIFLQCSYTPEAYEKEVERLQNAKKVYGGTIRTLLTDEENKYPYPAFIAIEQHHHTYEYALLTGDTQITYIFTAYYDREDVEFSQEYLPTDYMAGVPEGEDSFYYGYSIYMKRVDEALGGIDYDETRDENVEVNFGHTEWIEDSIFVVRVALDDQNREIITECVFCYYESPDDPNNVFTYDEESDDTYFNDLNGFEYRDLRLNEERTAVIVTYAEDGVEKEWEMDLRQYMGE